MELGHLLVEWLPQLLDIEVEHVQVLLIVWLLLLWVRLIFDAPLGLKDASICILSCLDLFLDFLGYFLLFRQLFVPDS